jgi:lipopolysaccharide transport system permease protein
MLRVADPRGHRMVSRSAEAPSIRRTLTGLHRYRHLLRNLVLKDLKLKYRGSVIGFAWSLANPLLMAAIYTVAFRNILKVRTEGFVFYLMLGLLAWTYFSSSAVMSTGAIVDNGGLVKSVRFPRAIATVLFNLAQYLLTVLVFLPLMLLFYRVPPGLPMLLFPVFVALQTLFTIGVALVLATGTAYFRDVRHLVEVALMVLFWTTPIVYTLHDMSGRLRPLILLSPVSAFVTAYHNIFFDRGWPALEIWVIAIVYTAIALTLGLWLMVKYEDSVAERV